MPWLWRRKDEAAPAAEPLALPSGDRSESDVAPDAADDADVIRQERAPTGDWMTLAPMPTAAPMPTTFRVQTLPEILTSHRSPALSGELGHAVSADGPSGLVSGLTLSTGPTRSADAASGADLTLRSPHPPAPEVEAFQPLQARPVPVASPEPLAVSRLPEIPVSRTLRDPLPLAQPSAGASALPVARVVDSAPAPASASALAPSSEPAASTTSSTPTASDGTTPVDPFVGGFDDGAASNAPAAPELDRDLLTSAPANLAAPIQPRALQRRLAGARPIEVPPHLRGPSDGESPAPTTPLDLPLREGSAPIPSAGPTANSAPTLQTLGEATTSAAPAVQTLGEAPSAPGAAPTAATASSETASASSAPSDATGPSGASTSPDVEAATESASAPSVAPLLGGDSGPPTADDGVAGPTDDGVEASSASPADLDLTLRAPTGLPATDAPASASSSVASPFTSSPLLPTSPELPTAPGTTADPAALPSGDRVAPLTSVQALADASSAPAGPSAASAPIPSSSGAGDAAPLPLVAPRGAAAGEATVARSADDTIAAPLRPTAGSSGGSSSVTVSRSADGDGHHPGDGHDHGDEGSEAEAESTVSRSVDAAPSSTVPTLGAVPLTSTASAGDLTSTGGHGSSPAAGENLPLAVTDWQEALGAPALHAPSGGSGPATPGASLQRAVSEGLAAPSGDPSVPSGGTPAAGGASARPLAVSRTAATTPPLSTLHVLQPATTSVAQRSVAGQAASVPLTFGGGGGGSGSARSATGTGSSASAAGTAPSPTLVLPARSAGLPDVVTAQALADDRPWSTATGEAGRSSDDAGAAAAPGAAPGALPLQRAFDSSGSATPSGGGTAARGGAMPLHTPAAAIPSAEQIAVSAGLAERGPDGSILYTHAPSGGATSETAGDDGGLVLQRSVSSVASSPTTLVQREAMEDVAPAGDAAPMAEGSGAAPSNESMQEKTARLQEESRELYPFIRAQLESDMRRQLEARSRAGRLRD